MSFEKKEIVKSSNMSVHTNDAHRDIPPTESLKERKVLFRFPSTQFDIEPMRFAIF